MDGETDQLVDLVDKLEFVPVDDTTAVGEVDGLPAAITILGLDPPAFLFQIRLNPADEQDVPPDDTVEPLVSDTEASMSIENGGAWLSVYDARLFECQDLMNLIDRLAQTVLSSGLAQPSVCLRCGCSESAELMYVEGRPTRLCPDCLDRASEERDSTETQLNRVSPAAVIGLPMFAVIAASIWAGFWLIIDLVCDYWSIEVIELNHLTMLLILGMLGAVGWCTGWPTGILLRRTAFGQRAPRITGVLLSLILIVAGEILYLTAVLYQEMGVIDPIFATQFVWVMVLEYTPFWMLCKLTLGGATGLFCCLSALNRRTVAMNI